MEKYVRVVISHFNEDLNWINNLEFPYTIYSKGAPHKESIKLENIGREANTYLHHIVNNYDNLDDYTIFLQGNPFDHLTQLPNRNYEFKSGYDPIKSKGYICDLNGGPQHTGLDLEYGFKKINKEPFYPLHFWANAMFIVDKDTIRKHPKEYYQNLLEFTKQPLKKPAHLLERLWQFIFE